MLVIGLNQGMPTKDEVHERNGREVHVPIERTVKHRPQESDDKLVFLSDQITVPGIPNVQYSIGDIVIALGIVDVCFEASRRPAPVRRLPRSGDHGVGLSTPRRSSTISSAPSTCSS